MSDHTLPPEHATLRDAMRCPKCRGDMRLIRYKDVEVERCEQCQGIWFDVGELDQLLDTDGQEPAAALDTGDARIGKQYDDIDNYPCPRCHGPMIRKTDPVQKHIHFETCRRCAGSFLDAGEFRDLASHTLADILKDLVAPRRR